MRIKQVNAYKALRAIYSSQVLIKWVYFYFMIIVVCQRQNFHPYYSFFFFCFFSSLCRCLLGDITTVARWDRSYCPPPRNPPIKSRNSQREKSGNAVEWATAMLPQHSIVEGSLLTIQSCLQILCLLTWVNSVCVVCLCECAHARTYLRGS